MTTTLIDPVPLDTPGAKEIGFELPELYNASAILFDNLARGNGGRPAVVGPAGGLTYDELCARAAQFGHALAGFGLKRGDRVLCLLDDGPTYPAVVFGAIRAGFVPVLLNTLSPPDLVQFYAEDSGARVAFVDAPLFERMGESVFRQAGVERVVLDGEGGSSEAAFRTGCPAMLEPADTHRDDMAFWMYSSGSTGKPKGVVHLQHDIAYTVESYARRFLKLTPDDVCFSAPKIFFAYGFGNSCSFPFAAGACAALMPGRPDPAGIFDMVRRFRPTVFFGLPTLYSALMADPAQDPAQGEADFSSVRLCVSAAEVLSNELFAAWRARFGHEIVEGLGSTEVLHIYLSNSEEAKRAGSAGRAVPGYEVRLVMPDGVTETERNGVMMVRGPSTAPCYWGRPDKTADTMRGDWIWTGDLFDRDAEGFYYFKGRADDLIKVSGQWVYPMEVELCLADHPQVRECAVLGVEVADRRMTLKAFVTLFDGGEGSPEMTSDLQAFVKRKLVPYKYPRVIDYLADLPKTGTGKLDRQALKRRV